MLDRRAFIGFATSAAALGVGPFSAAAWPATGTAIADYFQPFVERKDFSGYVLLVRDGRTLLSQGFGFADFDSRRPNTSDTAFMTASIGKLFTRAAVLELERLGKLGRTDPLSRFLPAFPGASAISIEQLVNHQAGIARDLPAGTDLAHPRSLDELIGIITRQPAVGKPGTGGYSNNGYRLLAKVIEVAGKGSYDDLVRELVFQPRKMGDTVSGVDLAGVKRRAVGYRPANGWRTIRPEPPVSLSNERGAGSFYVTAADLGRFLQTLPLEKADLEAAPRVDAQGKPRPRSVGHDGFGSGFANLAYAYPDERSIMVLLGNIQSGLFFPLHGDLRRMLFGEKVAPPTMPGEGSVPVAVEWSDFIGDYDLRPGNPLLIRRAGDQLVVDGGDGAHPLIALGGRRFFMRLRYATMTFEGEAGKPAALLRWSENGTEFPLKRIG